MNYFNIKGRLPKRLLGLLLVLPITASWAVGFGEINVHSYLNQPFDATVDLFSAESANNLSIELAGPSRYSRMDINSPANLSDFSASLQRVGGRTVVQINSRQPVTDLVIDLVLVLTADGSQQTRHYPVLIDFAPQLNNAVSEAPAQPESPRRSEPAPLRPSEPRRTVQAVRSGDSYGPIRGGQTLSGIVNELTGDQAVNGYQMMQAIVDLNPSAFINGDMNRMRAGVVLDLPQFAGFLNPGQTRQAAERPASGPVAPAPLPQLTYEPDISPAPASGASRRAPTPADPRLELVGTPTSGEILNSLNNWLDEDDTELGLRAQSARRDLAYAAAEIETFRKENVLLRDRVGELEQRLNTLRRLVALKAAEEAGTTVAEAASTQPGPVGVASATPVAPPPVDTGPAESTAAAPVGVESELAAVTASQAVEGDSDGPRWWPWVLAVLVLLGVTLVVWYRGKLEDKARAQRTADLVHRIQSAGERATGELAAVPSDPDRS